jgi:hypothetical protein
VETQPSSVELTRMLQTWRDRDASVLGRLTPIV